MAALDYPFTEEQAQAAHDQWGCNCGPTALAFALQMPLSFVRPLLPDFPARKYTNPTMMREALKSAGQDFRIIKVPVRTPGGGLDIATMYGENPKLKPDEPFSMMTDSPPHLVRVQWTGPWTKAGANPKWGYRMTHWICTWLQRSVPLVFDCNGGVMHHEKWEAGIVPLITASIPRADGGWYPTHIWRLC